MTKRERINILLSTRLEPLKESLGHQNYLDLVAAATNDIVEYFKEKDGEVIHVIGPNGQHRLVVDGESTKWRDQNEICRNGKYVASTDFYFGQLPQVGEIREFEAEDFMTTSQQDLNMGEIRFIKKDKL